MMENNKILFILSDFLSCTKDLQLKINITFQSFSVNRISWKIGGVVRSFDLTRKIRAVALRF